MIFDCCLYNGERDLLELRYNELKDVVDWFVICESTHTYSGHKKELSPDFSFIPNLIYVRHTAKPYRNPWKNETLQRNMLIEGVAGADDNDVIMLSDLDEIPDKMVIGEYERPYVVMMNFYYYYLNYFIVDEPWYGTVICRKKHIKTMQKLRERRFRYPKLIGGWHFSFLGGTDRIIKKLESFSHQKYNKERWKNRERIERLVGEKKDLFNRHLRIEKVEITDKFPETIYKNQGKWKHLMG